MSHSNQQQQLFHEIDGMLLSIPGPFQFVLHHTHFLQALQDHHVNFGGQTRAVYTPLLTLFTFLWQMIHLANCFKAVLQVGLFYCSFGRIVSTDTGNYCRARAKLPLGVFQDLVRGCAQRLGQAIPEHWKWRGRQVYLVDGTTVSMPDTPDNQQRFPQPKAQQPGLGFPLARVGLLICWVTGVIRDASLTTYKGKGTGESALLRQMCSCLQAGDLLLGDRNFCSYFQIALLAGRGVDVLFRLHSARLHRSTSRSEWIEVWPRPARPSWMSEADYQKMPPTLRLRLIRVQVQQRGFRTRSLVLVTTLTEEISPLEIAQLYRGRWEAELDIRSLKITLGADILDCQHAEMVEKELWCKLLSYNVARKVCCQSAYQKNCPPREISFTGALDLISMEPFRRIAPGQLPVESEGMYAYLLLRVSGQRVRNRPDRVEPRKHKRRSKIKSYLRRPRAQERASLLVETER